MKNSIHERALRIIYKYDTSTFQELLHKQNSTSVFTFLKNLFQYITRICEFWKQKCLKLRRSSAEILRKRFVPKTRSYNIFRSYIF